MSAAEELFDDFKNYLHEAGRSDWATVRQEQCTAKHVLRIPVGNDSAKVIKVISIKAQFTDLGQMGMASLEEKGAASLCVSCYRFAQCERQNYAAVLLKLNEMNRGEVAKVHLNVQNGMISADSSTIVVGELASRVCLWHESALESIVLRVINEFGDLITVNNDAAGLYELILTQIGFEETD